jgi:pimeloyl-ACP methyl ester carboxylesterase
MLPLRALAEPGVPDPDSRRGLEKDVAFTDYSPLSANAEIVRRLLSPLTAAQVPAALARAGKQLSGQPVDLAAEKFVLYVPEREPAQGFGLLVFVPPWSRALVPSDWVPLFDQLGIVFVAAEDSGNDTSVFARRSPLALLAEANAAKRYRIDPQRIYVAGFSGGSRVALRLALAYPDIFRGAILDAGSDPIGDSTSPLPPKDLLLRAQETTRFVYVTGGRDTGPLMSERASMHSLSDWCFFNVDSYAEPFIAHDVMNAATLSQALKLLSAPAQTNAQELAACRSKIESDLDSRLNQAEALVNGGKRDEARRTLLDIDAHFGGLAAPRIVDLFNRLGGS